MPRIQVLVETNLQPLSLIRHLLKKFTKINSKWIKYLNVRLDTIKLLEENLGRTLFHINCSNIFWICLLKEIKAKINKWDLIKLKSFGTAKETIDKTKRQPIEWEKIFANDMTNKGFVSRIYKQLIHLNIKKKKKKT